MCCASVSRAFLCVLAGCFQIVAQQNDPATRVYAQASKSVFLIVIRSAAGEPIAQGTGFLVTGGRIVTNQHVVRDGNPYLDLGAVKLSLKTEAVDSVNDLAILSVNGELSAPPLNLAASQPTPGTAIYAIGNPAGLERSISNGVVAGMRQLFGRELMQISAPISPGSSGGPILNSSSEVVAVAVGILEQGQNLNFAVPVKFVQLLLKGESPAEDVPTLLSRVDEISTKRTANEQYSTEPDSPWMHAEKEMEALLRRAVSTAGKDAGSLKLVAEKAMGLDFFTAIDPAIAVEAAEKIVQIKPTAESHLLLAKSLNALFNSESNTTKTSPTLQKAERAIRASFAATKLPTLEMYSAMGEIMEERELNTEARAAYVKAYDFAKAQNNTDSLASALRGLIRVAVAASNNQEADRWFNGLVESGPINFWDWQQQASRLYARGEYKNSGDAYSKAASQTFWTNYCQAAIVYSLDDTQNDRVLEMARACIGNGTSKANSDASLAIAHREIADRGCPLVRRK